ncbi:MAG: acyltransferase [Candidatus Nanohaloarchaea archaeon]|nr:acyltransferase [Candidatus Nanohaloarchaea archaeon]
MIIYPYAQIEGELDYPEGADGDIYDGCKIFVDLKLGENVHISTGVKMIGKEAVEIGKNSTISPNVVIYTSMPEIRPNGKNKYCPHHKPKLGKVEIGDDVYIGANSVIGHGVKIADGVVIGANSMVTESIDEPYTFWAGNPAKKVKPLAKPDGFN